MRENGDRPEDYLIGFVHIAGIGPSYGGAVHVEQQSVRTPDGPQRQQAA
jgi:hypothetical protein